jgi:hypothetical protein
MTTTPIFFMRKRREEEEESQEEKVKRLCDESRAVTRILSASLK